MKATVRSVESDAAMPPRQGEGAVKRKVRNCYCFRASQEAKARSSNLRLFSLVFNMESDKAHYVK
jgi:hypothetical protein